MKPFHHKNLRRAGFSLAELMVVIVIIGLLSTIVAPKLFSRFSKAQVGTAKASMKQIEAAAVEYMIQNNSRPPESLEDLVRKDESGSSYLAQETVPKDPWNNEYILEIEEGEPVIWCFGADGQEGGEGPDRDFSTKMITNQEI